MNIQYCSDLHLEFSENKHFLKRNPITPKGEVLLLAGDIVPFNLLDKHLDFFDYVSEHFEVTYWLPGNHEFYYSDVDQKGYAFHEQIKNNVFLVNNHVVNLNDIRFVCTTLWGKIGPTNQWIIQQSMSDFHVIIFKGGRFTPAQFNQAHKECIDFLARTLKEKYSGKTVILTHHVPTFINFPEQYRDNALNEAFVVELFDLINQSAIDYWVFGHHHFNIPEFSIGSTRLVTNQLGYVKYNENINFRLDACFKL